MNSAILVHNLQSYPTQREKARHIRMRLWSLSAGEETPRAGRGTSLRGMREALFASHLNAGKECEYLRQATNLIQINNRIIAPMIDMMKPAG
jgi:hypothetical protein